METGALTSHIDVAQATLYTFWVFFAGLIFYLRREDKREGYPLISDSDPTEAVEGIPPVPSPKIFYLADGTTRMAPRVEPRERPAVRPAEAWPGAPYEPTGNPMIDGIGPAAYAMRADEPDLTFDDRLPKIVPLRSAPGYFLALEDPDPRGMTVTAADRVAVGLVRDVWIDRSETIVRYLEVEIASAPAMRRVLVPIDFADISSKQRQIEVDAILASQFANVPILKNPDEITLLEEDKIMAYYAGGLMYATPGRLGPLL